MSDLCDPMGCSPPGSSVHGILQVRILECVSHCLLQGSSAPRGRARISRASCTGRRVLYHWCPWEPFFYLCSALFQLMAAPSFCQHFQLNPQFLFFYQLSHLPICKSYCVYLQSYSKSDEFTQSSMPSSLTWINVTTTELVSLFLPLLSLPFFSILTQQSEGLK